MGVSDSPFFRLILMIFSPLKQRWELTLLSFGDARGFLCSNPAGADLDYQGCVNNALHWSLNQASRDGRSWLCETHWGGEWDCCRLGTTNTCRLSHSRQMHICTFRKKEKHSPTFAYITENFETLSQKFSSLHTHHWLTLSLPCAPS